MIKRLLFAALFLAIGFVGGGVAFYLFGPLLYDRPVEEPLMAELETVAVARGTFRDADAGHRGSGTATILRTAGGAYLLRLEDFRVTNGPDLEVWLVEDRVATSDEVKASAYVSLGTLKGNVGAQTYVLPEGTDPARFQSVVIWCESFAILFSPADLAPL
ncbi:MAG: DM13 domain-containing protein [Hyphomicrobiaceae bacterium]|nr:DM13 domain-containing protein [Hyphomicrobiaceae bacterium]